MTTAIEVDAPATPTFTIVEEPNRIDAYDPAGAVICGAFRPNGHAHFLVYVTPRITHHLHQVIAPTAQIARWHVEMIAELFTAGAR